MLDELLKNPEDYADFEYLAYWQSQFNNQIAVAVFFAWIKVSHLAIMSPSLSAGPSRDLGEQFLEAWVRDAALDERMAFGAENTYI